jgi:Fic family protein
MSGSRAAPGQFRSVQNFIGGLKIEDARFIPPPPSEVPRLMTDLDRLIRYEPDPESHYDIGVLSRAPIAHAQFEAIHPFVDGNGRIGRLLFPLMFVCDGRHPIHLATFLKRRQREYYDTLLEVQMQLRWSSWVELFLECTVASCRHTVHLLRELRTVAERWQERLTARRTRKHATAWRVAELAASARCYGNLFGRTPEGHLSVRQRGCRRTSRDGHTATQGQQRRNRAFHAHEVMNLLYTGIDAVLDDVATLRNYRVASGT